MKLHGVTLLDELIAQFKDEAMMPYSVKYSFIDEIVADAYSVQGCIPCLLDKIPRLCSRRCRYEGAITIPKMARGGMEVCWQDIGQGTERP